VESVPLGEQYGQRRRYMASKMARDLVPSARVGQKLLPSVRIAQGPMPSVRIGAQRLVPLSRVRTFDQADAAVEQISANTVFLEGDSSLKELTRYRSIFEELARLSLSPESSLRRLEECASTFSSGESLFQGTIRPFPYLEGVSIRSSSDASRFEAAIEPFRYLEECASILSSDSSPPAAARAKRERERLVFANLVYCIVLTIAILTFIRLMSENEVDKDIFIDYLQYRLWRTPDCHACQGRGFSPL